MTGKRWLWGWGVAGLLVAVAGWLLWRALNQASPPAEATPAAPAPWTLTWTATAEPVTATPSPLPPTVTPTWTVTVTATGTATRTDTDGQGQTPTEPATVEKPAELPVTGSDLGE